MIVKFLYKWRANLIIDFCRSLVARPDDFQTPVSIEKAAYSEWQESVEQYVQHRINRRLDQTSNIQHPKSTWSWTAMSHKQSIWEVMRMMMRTGGETRIQSINDWSMRHGPNPKSDTLDSKKHPSRPRIFFSALHVALVKSLPSRPTKISVSADPYLRLTSSTTNFHPS